MKNREITFIIKARNEMRNTVRQAGTQVKQQAKQAREGAKATKEQAAAAKKAATAQKGMTKQLRETAAAISVSN